MRTARFLAAIATLGGLYSLAAVWGRGQPETSLLLAEVSLTAVGAGVVGGWIALRVRPRPDLVALTVGLIHASLAWPLLVVAHDLDGRPGLQWFLWSLASAALITAWAGILRFFTLFPRRITRDHLAAIHRGRVGPVRIPEKEKDREILIRIITFFQGPRLWPVAGAVALLESVRLALDLTLWPSADADPGLLVFAVSVAWCAPLAVYFSTLGLGGSGPEDRRRLQWIHWGLIAAVLSFMLFGALLAVGLLIGFESDALTLAIYGSVGAGPFLVLLGIAIAVLYQGTVDPTLVICRTSVYGFLSVVFVFCFAALGNIVSELVEARLGLPGIVGTGLYGGGVAVLLLPFRGWTRRQAERWVPHARPTDPAGAR